MNLNLKLMKKIILLLFTSSLTLLFLNSCTRDSSHLWGSPLSFWYYAEGKKITLPISYGEVAVRFKKDISADKKAAIITETSGVNMVEAAEVPDPEMTLLTLRPGLQEKDYLDILSGLRKKREVRSAYPVFNLPDARQTITDQFVVRFKSDISDKEIESINSTNKVEIIQKLNLADTYVLEVSAGDDSLAMANAYHESDLTIYATPDFIRFLSPAFNPNDTHYPNQWGLENTDTNPPDGVGTPDSDIDASKAWDITLGDPGIIIAIVDEGVELEHEDLRNKIVSGFSAITDDTDENPNNTWDAHGTNCAGIAAAETDNGIGMAGVCPRCSLMSIQIAYTRSNRGGYWTTYDSWIADAMIWAVDHGADVLSNSWGGGTSSDLINDAISYALKYGRDGLGSVILAASGNNNGAVSFPASNKNTIAVGASSPCDERTNPDSCDGENWGSNYGPQLDIVSPGVEWWSTDMMGNAGYTSGNYFDHMNGTSSATPAAAGLAGLILSYKPCLTAVQVREILRGSAQDLVGLPSEDTPGWDPYMGWGRINANDALLLADTIICPDKLLFNSYLPFISP